MKLKKNEIVVYAIALMLVTAGYFNYINFDKNTQETYSEDIETETEKIAGTGDAVLVSNNEVECKNEVAENEEDKKVENVKNVEITSIASETENYYASSKLDREKMYAEMLASYEGILNNANVTEAQKTIATQEIAKINNAKNAIMICENLILSKGFNNCVIFVNDKQINVVVNITGGLETKAVVQVQNIISRELNTDIENIHITEK